MCVFRNRQKSVPIHPVCVVFIMILQGSSRQEWKGLHADRYSAKSILFYSPVQQLQYKSKRVFIFWFQFHSSPLLVGLLSVGYQALPTPVFPFHLHFAQEQISYLETSLSGNCKGFKGVSSSKVVKASTISLNFSLVYPSSALSLFHDVCVQQYLV